MKQLVLFLMALLSGFVSLHATHNIAGEITYKCIGGNTYEITVTTYTNSTSPADRCELLVDWGDGTEEVLPRSNGAFGQCPSANQGFGVMVPNYVNVKQNLYIGVHTYSPGTYVVNIKDPNRVTGIENIPNSVNVPFYLQTTLTVDPNIGCNNGPQLESMPLDKACKGKCFYHNPGAYDPDGDSLAFKIGPCLDTNGTPIPGYLYPDDFTMGGGTMDINVVTGDLSWCSPQRAGKYNVVIYIEEWRIFPNGNRAKIGTVLRDMSIDVMDQCQNDNPEIPDLPDLCVDAGALVGFSFVVTDPNGDDVRMEGYGGPFNTTPQAAMAPVNTYQNTPLNVSFSWQTTCEHVRLQPWTVTIKATDQDMTSPPVQLIDLESVNITVVSPGPQTLTATPQGANMNLAWSASPCQPLSNPVAGYKIYRRQGPSGWNPQQCETGVPQPLYILIGTVGPNGTTFVDDNGGTGLIPGVNYCYRVHTVFLDGAESYASPEACNELRRDVPVITNVDITSTDASNGTIDVRWENPLANGFDFDTVLNPGPYTIEIYRTDNAYLMSSTPVLAGTITVPMFYQLPTLFQDASAGLNTATEPHTYRLNFFGTAGGGNSQSASSVFLTATPSDNQVLLTWQDTTPWQNYAYAIFRYNTSTTLWDSIGYTSNNSYVDDSLINGVLYCYYVKSHGSYFNPQLPPLLLNRSQERCATPQDLTPPCAPSLVVNSDCFIAQNQLIWTNPNHMNCGTDDVVTYNIWYTPIEGQDMTVIATVTLSSDTMIVFSNLTSVAGCYAVTALDTFGNQSALSNMVCVDNCPVYELPNVFTPNADGINDVLIPFPYQYIESVDLKIFDRWGVLVFETTDPAINWNGHDKNSGKLCTDGVYFYTCTVNEIHLQGIIPRKINGFVHLFGKDIRGE